MARGRNKYTYTTQREGGLRERERESVRERERGESGCVRERE